jgi:hypothetical protein
MPPVFAAPPKCKICLKSVYPMDPQINLDGSLFHTSCAKCEDCKCQITISNFCKNENEGKVTLLCKTHYFKRFHEGGAYIGGDKFQVKATRDVQATRRSSLGGVSADAVPPSPSKEAEVAPPAAPEAEAVPTPAPEPEPTPAPAAVELEPEATPAESTTEAEPAPVEEIPAAEETATTEETPVAEATEEQTEAQAAPAGEQTEESA